MFSISRLQQLMKALPRGVFDAGVRQHTSDRYSKRFGSWDQLVAMLFGHLSGASSLRTLEAGYNSQTTQHYHLGTGALRRSTLTDANRKRSCEPFAQVARTLMGQVNRTLRRDSDSLLYLLDSTSITLKGRGFDPWTLATRNCHTQGMKLHVVYAADTKAPVHHSLTAANVNDVVEGARIPIKAGAVYVFDKGYCDYNWWAQIHAQGATFVTRFKSNAALQVVHTRPIPDADKDTVLRDEIVRFSNKCPGAKRRNHYTETLRRVTIARPGKDTPLVLATNDLESPATRIAQHYKDRWQIELFFKWIKQHLRIKHFLGRTENAVKIQILCALIAYLLVAIYRKQHGLHASLWIVLAELRASLFQRPATEATLYQRRRERFKAMQKRQGVLFA